MRLALAALISLSLTGLPLAAGAQSPVRTEALSAGAFSVTLHLHPFLQGQELEVLRQLGASEEAMLAFIGPADSYGAIAVSPRQGFFRDGAPVPSALPISQLPDAETARRAAIDACSNAAGGRCVVVLEAGPVR